jgi:hypothetical protein
MGNFVRTALTAVMVGMLSLGAAAQARLTVSDDLVTGESTKIEYSDPDRANTKIIVTIDNGRLPEPTYEYVEIQLDDNGYGSAEWEVAAWNNAFFNAPGVEEQARVISSGSERPAQAPQHGGYLAKSSSRRFITVRAWRSS